jgi:hypothetical protein
VTIQPNLAAWLQAYPLDRFPIIPLNARGMISQVRARFALSHDVLRHTFISMHVARFRSMGDTALQAGNSESIIRRHYLNMVSEEESSAFFQIIPRGAARRAGSAP